MNPRITMITLGVDGPDRAVRFYRDTFWGGYAGAFHGPGGHPWKGRGNPQRAVRP